MDELRQNHHPKGSDRDAEDGRRPRPEDLPLADAERPAAWQRTPPRPAHREDPEILHSEVIDVPPPIERDHHAKRIPQTREVVVLSREILSWSHERGPTQTRCSAYCKGGQEEGARQQDVFSGVL